MAEDHRPVALNVLVPSDTVADLGQHRSEGGFADIERITSEVVAVQFDEVERVRISRGGKHDFIPDAGVRQVSGRTS